MAIWLILAMFFGPLSVRRLIGSSRTFTSRIPCRRFSMPELTGKTRKPGHGLSPPNKTIREPDFPPKMNPLRLYGVGLKRGISHCSRAATMRTYREPQVQPRKEHPT